MEFHYSSVLNCFNYFCHVICCVHIVQKQMNHFFGYEREEYELCYVYKCFSNQDQVSWNTECCLTVLLGCMSLTLKLN